MLDEPLTRIEGARDSLRSFCRRWKIVEFSLFGSVLRDDFHEGSDIDVLASFAEDARWSIFDHLRMERELSELLGAPAEIVTRRALDESGNWVIRKNILESARRLDVA